MRNLFSLFFFLIYLLLHYSCASIQEASPDLPKINDLSAKTDSPPKYSDTRDFVSLKEAEEMRVRDSIHNATPAPLPEGLDLSLLDSLNQARKQANAVLAKRPCVPLPISKEDVYFRLKNGEFFTHPQLLLSTAERKKLLAKDTLYLERLRKEQARLLYVFSKDPHELYVSSNDYEDSRKKGAYVDDEVDGDIICHFLKILELSNHTFCINWGYWTSNDGKTMEEHFIFVAFDSLSQKLMLYPNPPRIYVRDLLNFHDLYYSPVATMIVHPYILETEVYTGLGAEIENDTLVLETSPGFSSEGLLLQLCGYDDFYFSFNEITTDYFREIEEYYNLNWIFFKIKR